MAENKSKNALGSMLSYLAMGVGQGMTGQPYLTNFQNMQMKQQELELEAPYKQQIKQGQIADALKKQVDVGAITSEQAMAEFSKYFPANGTPPPMGVMTPNTGGASNNITGLVNPFISSLEKKKQESSIQSNKEAEAQGLKMAEQTSRDYYRTTSAIDTTFDQALSFSDEQYKNWGLKPGDFLGLADKMTPPQWNQFKDAYEGSTREAAALVARLIIPQSRAIQMVDVFAKSVSKIGSTIEANASNIAATMQNGFGNALANNMDVKDINGNNVKIQDIVIDKVNGEPLSQLGFKEKQYAINRIKKEFSKELRTFYLGQAYLKNPKLLNSETIKELRSIAMEFDGIEEVEAANLPPGKVVSISGRMGVTE